MRNLNLILLCIVSYFIIYFSKRDISAKNYVIHSVHCERKIQLCDRCLEPVPRSELEKHEEEFHSKDTCSECGISVEKWQVEKHKVNMKPAYKIILFQIVFV